ncbi:MAG: HAMP domain-containing histidine kinase [Ignavibacteria bacterium]|nr:HAMP domain-containing histidine kinase [Ignavibacteria bacterium]
MKTFSTSTLPRSSKTKIFLLAFAFLFVAGTLWYTHTIVKALQAREAQVADLYAKSLQYLASDEFQTGDYSFVLDEIIWAIDFPMILTDAQNEPISPLSSAYRNIDIDSSASPESQRALLRQIVAEMDMMNEPIYVTHKDSVVLTVVHYGESPLITTLRWLPYVEIALVALFIFIGYVSFSYVKRHEQSNIWVGMARETAHQLGTPISSMMGWIELLKSDEGSRDPEFAQTLHDMENDLLRLSKIADRFSKIGSKPDLREENVTEVIERVLKYFERRIPNTGKKVSLILKDGQSARCMLNRELFEWVIENLIKNALDAIEEGLGWISISIDETAHSVIIDVTDNGKGIDPSHRRDVFRPGFSTKTRGWGLGLSLSKRIIESYHRGKLSLKESRPGHGTTFRIKLKK